MAYCTVNDIVAYLDIEAATDDALIESLIDRAQSAIDAHCRRTFEAAADTTRYIDAAGDHVRGRTLFFDHIGELAAITTVTNGDGVEVTSSQYVTHPRNRTPYMAIKILSSVGKSWTYTDDYEDAISITGRWAYSTTVPNDIKQACVRWVGYMYRQKDAQVFETTAIPEAGVIQVPQGIPRDVRLILAPYRRLAI